MKWLIAFVVLVITGLVGIVVTHHSRDGSSGSAGSNGPAVATISHGEIVDIKDHLGSGYTLVEFTADW